MTNTLKDMNHPMIDHEYNGRIQLVQHYIGEHCDEPLTLKVLAQVAGFSPFHFHRLFTAFVGEPLASYIRRVRLQQAANQLHHSTQTISEIALSAGYATHSAFGKAFKQHFGMSPSQYRRGKQNITLSITSNDPFSKEEKIIIMSPEIRTLPNQQVLYARAREVLIDNSFDEAPKQAFGTLFRFIEEQHLSDKWQQCLAIFPDDATDDPQKAICYDAGVTLHDGVKVEATGEVAFQTLKGGRWALFMHKGPYDTIWRTWQAAYRDWLPTSGEDLRDAPPYEVYLNNANEVAAEEVLTAIYIPIQ